MIEYNLAVVKRLESLSGFVLFRIISWMSADKTHATGVPMFAKERQDAIAALVKAEGRVTVTSLAQRFDVTEDCIRKDLKLLDSEGLLKRVYGGAIGTTIAPERDVSKRLNTHVAEKIAEAADYDISKIKKAYEYISSGDLVFLDISTTNIALAELIATGNKRLTVVSNMIDVLRILARNPMVTAICTGGNVNLEFDGFLGATALAMVEPIRFDKAFIGALSVDLENDAVTTFDVDDGLLKKRVVTNASHSYLVADARKLSTDGNYVYARMEDFDAFITNKPTPALRKQVEALGTKLV